MQFVACLFACFLFAGSAVAQSELEGWLKELKRAGDEAEVKLVQKVANQRTRAALDGLLEVYEHMGSIYMRREIVKVLSRFDGVAEAQQPAVEKIASVATESEAPELRDAAIRSLGRCQSLGRHYLRLIVDSDADDGVRLKAMRAHVRGALKKEADWYRYIWNPKRERRKDENKKVIALELEVIRELAFTGLAKDLSDSDLVEVIKHSLNAKIRRLALDTLKESDSSKTREMAKRQLGRVDIPGADRADAARILAVTDGPKTVALFIKLAKKKAVTPEDLRLVMAGLIVEMDDAGANKKVAKLVGKGKAHEKVFALRATLHLDDPKLLKKVRKGLKDRDVSVRRATAEVLAVRRDRDCVPELYKMIESPRDPDDVRIAVEALGGIQGSKRKWMKELLAFAEHENRNVRNAALDLLAVRRSVKYLSLFLKSAAHLDWTTRLVALNGLVAMRSKDAVPVLIERLDAESGRMSEAVADALWNLTGKPFDEDLGRWQAWWKAEAAEFKVISKNDLDDAKRELEMRRLRQRTSTKAKFFGIKITSHRVIFILDVSGSMSAVVHGRFVGKREASRLDVAKEELVQCIKNLDAKALFNVLAFSSGVMPWIKPEDSAGLGGGVGGTSVHPRSEALVFIERLGATGATNLYDTLEVAFQDADVDTIFVMSDGEPTNGQVIDPSEIRQDVKLWNKHRRIKINTIAIGGSLEVLEWIAEDSGGYHVRIR